MQITKRLTPNKGWDQTPGKQGTSNTCIKSAKKCQGTVPFLLNDPVLLWFLGKHSKILAPLTGLVGEYGQTKSQQKIPWHWDEIHQKAFNALKSTIAKDAVLAYLDYWKVLSKWAQSSHNGTGHWCFSVGNYLKPNKNTAQLKLNS